MSEEANTNKEAKSTPKSPAAEREEKILAFWDVNDIFEKTLKKESPKGEFVFYEGPPTANGKPGIHHAIPRVFKDAIPRYKTMQGFHVRRRAGWDTHGLPVELQVEKELGLKSKKEIEEYGIVEFNKKCKESVFRHIDEFEKFTARIGYWTDFDNAYFTFHNSYIETVWNIVAKVNDDKLLYKDYKVVPWCARCGTTLSSHELAQGYVDVKDLTVYVKFEILNSQFKTYILAWTTTPWTLPGNVALAVGEKIDYVKVKAGEEFLILAEAKLSLLAEGYEVIEKMKGSDLVGLSYESLYPFLKDSLPESEKEKLKNAFKVYVADFVTIVDGTGIVHIAPMYGQDDFELGTKVGLPKYHLINPDGHFKDECGFLSGGFVKDEEVAVEVIKDLAHRGLLFKKEKYEHSYPHCWRCKTPLIYYARDSWYIRMSQLRDKLVSENENINWEPSYIKEGRFGEWLREIKDWAISRERYWGTPLPVWQTEDKSEMLVVDSIDTLKKHTKKSGNKYFLMRHGEAENNTKAVFNSTNETVFHLTKDGKDQIEESMKVFKSKNKIDLIIHSPLMRTKETAEIIANLMSIPLENLIVDQRIREINLGFYEGKARAEIFKEFPDHASRFETAPVKGESLLDVKKRVGEFLYEIETKYQNKNIMIVSHGDPIWMCKAVVEGFVKNEILNNENSYPKNAEIAELDFVPLPHNPNFELDLHKPFIDESTLLSESGKPMQRVKEVMDVWFDSGAMPFAQDAADRGGKLFDEYLKGVAYPADFISEAIDQTRGWFYTLHAVGVLMGRGKAYKNVICLGHLLDKNGKKMSKSLGNVIDPWVEMDKFGIDAIRLWMYSVNQPGESKNYDEKTVDEINKKVFNLVTNVFSFYELYRDNSLEGDTTPSSPHVLDQWILVRLDMLIIDTTKYLEIYKLLEPVRAIREFIDDLSTWYLQLSRDRFRDGDAGAKQTLYFVLKNLAKLLAPFAPFYAEDLYQKLRTQSDVESVHLEVWPTNDSRAQKFFEVLGSSRLGSARPSKNFDLLDSMQKTRDIVSFALDARMKSNVKVRQPLAKISVKKSLEVAKEYQELVKERVNVKEVVFVDAEDLDVSLDTEITEILREEGVVRELIRFVQDLRKKKGLTPSDKIILSISANASGKSILEKPEWSNMLKGAVLASEINFEESGGERLQIEDLEFIVSFIK